MTTATVDRGLYAVPPPPPKERFAILLAIKTGTRRALEALLALPRGAAG